MSVQINVCASIDFLCIATKEILVFFIDIPEM